MLIRQKYKLKKILTVNVEKIKKKPASVVKFPMG